MDVLIDGVKYVKEPERRKPPKNDLSATHWAELPDGSTLFYKIGVFIHLWVPASEVWLNTNNVPYTLYCFDDYCEESSDAN